MRFSADNITVLGTAGDRKLGGYDFDKKIIDDVIDSAISVGIDITTDATARQDLQLKAEAAKKSLSSKDKTTISLNVGGKPFKYMINREHFLDLVEPLLYKTVSSMENACDEAVAIGAAFHVLDVLKMRRSQAEKSGKTDSNILDTNIPEITKQYSFTDVTSHGIGIVITDEYGNETNSVILPKNVQVPAEQTNIYQTTVPYQEKLAIQVTQGEEEDLRYVTIIGTADIEISPREQLVGIEVSISCDENSIIHVRVFDQDLRKDLGEMNIDRVSNLSEEEVKQNMIKIRQLDISGE